MSYSRIRIIFDGIFACLSERRCTGKARSFGQTSSAAGFPALTGNVGLRASSRHFMYFNHINRADSSAVFAKFRTCLPSSDKEWPLGALPYSQQAVRVRKLAIIPEVRRRPIGAKIS